MSKNYCCEYRDSKKRYSDGVLNIAFQVYENHVPKIFPVEITTLHVIYKYHEYLDHLSMKKSQQFFPIILYGFHLEFIDSLEINPVVHSVFLTGSVQVLGFPQEYSWIFPGLPKEIPAGIPSQIPPEILSGILPGISLQGFRLWFLHWFFPGLLRRFHPGNLHWFLIGVLWGFISEFSPRFFHGIFTRFLQNSSWLLCRDSFRDFFRVFKILPRIRLKFPIEIPSDIYSLISSGIPSDIFPRAISEILSSLEIHSHGFFK